MEDFWKEKHIAGDIGALSGCGYITIFYLQLDNIFPSAAKILNIGVGLGKFEKACVQAGKLVDSVDITEQAGVCVAGVARNFYTSVGYIRPYNYDLITELLVAQHISDAELEKHIKHAIMGLWQGGIYAVQSPTYINPVSPQLEAQMRTPKFMQGGRVCRSNEWFEAMAKKHGGKVVDIRRVWEFPQYNMIWNVYHIRRQA